MNRYFHNLVLGVSVLPALLVMPAVAKVATIGETSYDTLHEAIAAAINNSTILVTENVAQGEGQFIGAARAVDFSVDFGGNTYTFYKDSKGSTGYETQAFHAEKNNTITLKNGTLEIAKRTSDTGYFYMGIQNYSDLTLDNMTVDGSNLSYLNPYTVSTNNGTSLIKNSTIIAKKGGYALDVYYWPSNTYVDGVYVTLQDSNLIGKVTVGPDGVATKENTLTHAILNIKGNNTITGDIINTWGTVNVKEGELTLDGKIVNSGMVNFESGSNFTTSLNGSTVISGDGTLVIASGATLNIGTNSIDVHDITLNGNVFATLREGEAQIKANSFDGTGKLNLTLTKVGTYNVFGVTEFGDVWSNDHIVNTNPIYELSFNNDGSVVASKKSVADIAADTGMKADTATAISYVADAAANAESKQLQELSVKIQEKLVENTPEAVAAVEHATKAVNPETKSVSQSVSTSVQNTVVSLASARMSVPSVGRSGGDVEWTKGGVWAQGLFNKSKQADAFNGYTRGIALGMDGTINKDWTIGAGYSYAHSDINGTARNTEIDSNTIFVYGQYKPTQWYVNAIANYTMSDYSERGTILDGIAVTGDYDVDSFGGALATGYDFRNGITPELGLRYMHVNANDYANSYGIKTHMDDTDFLTGVAGLKYAFNIAATRHMTFAPQLSAAMKYDMLSDKNIATVTMPGLDAYTLEGSRLNRIGGEFGIGLGMQYRDLELSVNYDIDVREDYTSQTGMLKFRYNF